MLSHIDATAPDPLYAAAAAYAADPRGQKIDLSVGVYRDGDGRSPVMAAIKAAEARMVRDQDSKAYRPLLGDPTFLRGMTELVAGADNPLLAQGQLVAIQTTGGTGALRLAAALARSAVQDARIHLGLPSWPSHAGVFASADLTVVEHCYWVPGAEAPDWEAILRAAANTRADDLFLMHGPCHNPTGIDLTREQRQMLLATLAETGATPMLDVAYYGLADGLETDLQLVRDALANSRRAIVAVSCSKAFGLYRDRTGILFVACADADEATRVAGRLGSLSRLLVSSAPAHGAEAVSIVLDDPALKLSWQKELDAMRRRITALRCRLKESGVPALRPLDIQKGIFAMLPLSPGQVATLGRDHAIYMPPSGRANLVGLKDGDIEYFIGALEQVTAAQSVTE